MTTIYSQIPSIDLLLRQPDFAPLINQYGRHQVTLVLRTQQQDARQSLRQYQQLPSWQNSWHLETQRRLASRQHCALSPVFNLTGTILHTNLGRAPLAESAIDAVVTVMRHPVTLEYDIKSGERSHRDRALAERLCHITGAEDACIVNNNAAAVLLMLTTLACGREVVISRGKLVEIGGAFRIPDIMRQAGCTLKETGTTNRTHLHDYQQAICEQTALLMKVHTSNYKIVGYTHTVNEVSLAELARKNNILLISDLGSGSLIDLAQYGLPAQPMPQHLLAAGVDLVSFSSDKLLGGPQAGIILGRRKLIARLQRHPLKRAVRADKMTLSALDATLTLYQQPETLTSTVPLLRQLTRHPSEIAAQARRLLPALSEHFTAWRVEAEACVSQIGSGSSPADPLPSYALTFTPLSGNNSELTALAQRLRMCAAPVIGRVQNGKLWLDLRCLDDESLFMEMLLS